MFARVHVYLCIFDIKTIFSLDFAPVYEYTHITLMEIHLDTSAFVYLAYCFGVLLNIFFMVSKGKTTSIAWTMPHFGFLFLLLCKQKNCLIHVEIVYVDTLLSGLVKGWSFFFSNPWQLLSTKFNCYA